MKGSRSIRRVLARETLLALIVLALSFLNFGHASLALAANGQVVVTGYSFCGNPITPDDNHGHLPCHACRTGGAADLPAAPGAPLPVAFGTAPVIYCDAARALAELSAPIAAQPRAPPAA